MTAQSATLAEWVAQWSQMDQPRQGFGFQAFKTFVVAQGWHVLPAKRVITVAGTNGKGSCVAALHDLCRTAQLSVLSYTSPHIHDLTERYRWNDAPIDAELLLSVIQSIECLAPPDDAWSFFECLTLACFRLVGMLKPDVVLLEVGLGGRLDCVNATMHHGAVITSIDHDHESVLGDDIASIAREKAGIIRPNVPVIWGSGAEVLPVIQQMAVQRGAPCIAQALTTTLSGSLPLVSLHAAQLAWKHCFPKDLLTDHQVKIVLEQAKLPGRFQVMQCMGRTWVFDVAHNPSACRHLCQQLRCHGYRTVDLLCAWSADKAVLACLEALKPMVSQGFAMSGNSPRQLSVTECLLQLNRVGILARSLWPINQAILDHAVKPGGVVLVCGSFAAIAQVQAALRVK